jgi:RHS repeat-associated protein
VTGNELKEEIVLRRRPASTSFAFVTSGGDVDVAGDGSARLTGGTWSSWRFAKLEVLDANGAPIDAAAPTLSVSGPSSARTMTASVDPTWLASVSDDAFPLVVDPTLYTGSSNSSAYRNDGASCPSCPIRVGNPDVPGQTLEWRSVAYFPYESLFGKRIAAANVHVWNLTAGTANGKWMNVYHGGWDWPTIYSASSLGTDWMSADYYMGSDSTYPTGNLANLYDWLLSNNLSGAALKFLGEWNSGFSYKQLSSFELELEWYTPPSTPTLNSPTPSGVSLHTLTPTLSASVTSPGTGESYLQDQEICDVTGGITNWCAEPGGYFGMYSMWALPTGWLDWKPIVRGLTADYFQDYNHNTLKDANETTLLHRIDTSLRFDYSAAAASPNPGIIGHDYWLAQWKGTLLPPAGTGWYKLGTRLVDDRMVVRSGATTLLDHTCCHTSGTLNLGATAVQLGSGGAPIDVSYTQVTGPSVLQLVLVKCLDDTSACSSPGPDTDVQANWLRPDSPALPDGWSRSGDALVPDGYTAVRPVGPEVTAVVDSSGADHLYTRVGAGEWTPPGDEVSVLTQRTDGTWSLLGDDGYFYDFTAEGRLQSVDAPQDDLRAGQPTYTFTAPNNDGIMRLTKITDATGRDIDLFYGNGVDSSGCATAPSGFDASAPRGMLCRVRYTHFVPDEPNVAGMQAGETRLFYSQSQLARIVNPGFVSLNGVLTAPTVDFGYGVQSTVGGYVNMLTSVRGELANDLIGAGVITDPGTPTAPNQRYLTRIAYTDGRATTITAPVASGTMTDPQRSSRSYAYTTDPATGRVSFVHLSVAGAEQPNGYSRFVVFDETVCASGCKATSYGGHATTERTADGVAVETWWDSFHERVLKRVDHHHQADPTGGLVTTNAYDTAGNPTVTYGPGSPAEVPVPSGAQRCDQATATTAPVSKTCYDGGLSGLAAAWFPNASLAATPKLHTTTSPNVDWTSGGPSPSGTPVPTDKFSGRLTGEVDLAQNATLTLTADGGRVFVDDAKIVDTWGGPYRDGVGDDAPLGYWRLGETSGTAAADAAGSNPGTYSGAVALGAAGGLGADDDRAASYNGSPGEVTVPDNAALRLNGPFTIELVAKTPSFANTYPGLLRKGPASTANGYLIFYGVDGRIYFKRNNASASTAAGALTAAYRHFALTYDGSTARWYVDGVQVSATTMSWPASGGMDALQVGRGDEAGNHVVDEVAVYDKALSASRVQAHATARTAASSTATSGAVTAGAHRIRVDYQELVGNARLQLTTSDPTATFKPRYNLVTSTTDADGKTASTTYSDPSAGLGPEHGLPTSSTVNAAAGVDLVSTTTYETPGVGFLRAVSRATPAGPATTYAYYGAGGVPATAVNPCVGGAAVDQRGALQKRTGPDPDGAGAGTARVEELVYDDAGRVVASRVDAQPWSCTAYDARGRPTQRTEPAFGAEAARTVSFNYAYGGTPAVAEVADGAGAIRTTVDWMGRPVSYRDAWGNTTTTSYDQAGRARDTSGPAGATHVDFDAGGFGVSAQKVDGLTVATASYHAPSGLQTGASYPTGAGNGGNGTSLTIGRDIRGRASKLDWRKPDASLLASDEVTSRSLAGDALDEKTDGVDNHVGNNFVYDNAGRLTTGYVGDPTQSYAAHEYRYAYDAVSAGCAYSMGNNTNRTSSTVDGGTPVTYCYDRADRLTSVSNDARYASPAYDARDNTSALGAQVFGYDGADRHVVTSEGNTSVRYTRDATDRVIARSVSVPQTVALRGASSGSNGAGDVSLSLSRPAGVQAGDLLIAQVTVVGGSGVAVAAPSGWSSLSSVANGTAVSENVYWRAAAAGDPVSWSWTWSGSQKASGAVVAYSGADVSAAPVFAAALVAGTSLSAPSVTTVRDNAAVLSLLGVQTGTAITPGSGQAERWEASSSGGTAASRTTSEGADKLQPVAGASGTRTATAAASVTGVAHSVVVAPAVVVTTTRYGYSGPGDTPDITQDVAGVVTERVHTLVGGVLLTKRSSGDVWSYPNLHGDVMATATASGVKQGSTRAYDPYGGPLAGVPDNSAGNLDYGWLGQHQRPTEQDPSGTAIEMGARLYAPGLGRFLEVDPVEGGSANDYDYVNGDPVNNLDLDGQWCWSQMGTTCTRYVKDKYGRTVPVQHRFRAKVETKHGISWGTQKWLIRNLNQVGGDGTRVEYGGLVGEYRCSLLGGCVPTGRSAYVLAVVDFKSVNGRTFGLITMHCQGSIRCPSWVNTRIRA